MHILHCLEVCLVQDEFLRRLSLQRIGNLARVCRQSFATHAKYVHIIWSVYIRSISHEDADRVLLRMFTSKPGLASITLGNMGDVAMFSDPSWQWNFTLAASANGYLCSIRKLETAMTVSTMCLVLQRSHIDDPLEWVWWANALLEKTATRYTHDGELVVCLLGVRFHDVGCFRAVCAHLRYRIKLRTVYIMLSLDYENIAWFERKRTANLWVLLETLEVRNGWLESVFRTVVEVVLENGRLDLFLVLARFSGYYDNRGIYFAMRRELREMGFGAALGQLHCALP